MSSPSDNVFSPAMSIVICSVCNRAFEELTSIVLLEMQSGTWDLKCIECDPEADYAPYLLTSSIEAGSN